MSISYKSNARFCSFIGTKKDKEESSNNVSCKLSVPKERVRRPRCNCCQACAWREEELRQEQRLKKQTTLPQRLGQKCIDGFLAGSFTTQELAVPLFAVVLLLLLCDKRRLVEGLGFSSEPLVPIDQSITENEGIVDTVYLYPSPRSLFIIVAAIILVVLIFNVIKGRLARYPGLNTNQLEHLRELYVPKETPENQARKMKYANILSKAIQCKTVSSDESSKNLERNTELRKLHGLLAESFPTVYQKYPPTIINDYSLLFKIPGQEEDKKPIMMCAHLDVVPAPSNKDYPWIHDPFSGDIVNGIIHGRGAIDNKHNVVGQLGAMEEILHTGELPKRTTYISMGHDEEISGFDGAAHIARYLQERKIKFQFILDEGTMIIAGALPGIRDHVGIVGCVEKGSIAVELTVTGPGGHSSIPSIKDDNPLKIMGKAIVALECNPVPAIFSKGTMFRNTIEDTASELSFPLNVICSNLWVFGGLFKQILLRASNGAAASIRTTTAVTKVHGGDKVNVIPSEVNAIINHRIHPNNTIESVLEHDRYANINSQ